MIHERAPRQRERTRTTDLRVCGLLAPLCLPVPLLACPPPLPSPRPLQASSRLPSPRTASRNPALRSPFCSPCILIVPFARLGSVLLPIHLAPLARTRLFTANCSLPSPPPPPLRVLPSLPLCLPPPPHPIPPVPPPPALPVGRPHEGAAVRCDRRGGISSSPLALPNPKGACARLLDGYTATKRADSSSPPFSLPFFQLPPSCRLYFLLFPRSLGPCPPRPFPCRSLPRPAPVAPWPTRAPALAAIGAPSSLRACARRADGRSAAWQGHFMATFASRASEDRSGSRGRVSRPRQCTHFCSPRISALRPLESQLPPARRARRDVRRGRAYGTRMDARTIAHASAAHSAAIGRRTVRRRRAQSPRAGNGCWACPARAQSRPHPAGS